MLFIRAMLILKDGENKNLKSKKYTPSKRKLIAKNITQSGLAGKKNTSPKKKYISHSVPN